MQRQLDHNFSPNLPLRVILPIIMTPLNWILIHVHICTSNNIVLAGTDEFLMPFDHMSRGKFYNFSSKKSERRGIFSQEMPNSLKFSWTYLANFQEKYFFACSSKFLCSNHHSERFGSEAWDPDSRSISHFHPIKQYKKNYDIHREESNSTLSHFLLH